jgi:hypothetical protein
LGDEKRRRRLWQRASELCQGSSVAWIEVGLRWRWEPRTWKIVGQVEAEKRWFEELEI